MSAGNLYGTHVYGQIQTRILCLQTKFGGILESDISCLCICCFLGGGTEVNYMTTNPSCTVEVLEIRIKFVLFLKAQTQLFFVWIFSLALGILE